MNLCFRLMTMFTALSTLKISVCTFTFAIISIITLIVSMCDMCITLILYSFTCLVYGIELFGYTTINERRDDNDARWCNYHRDNELPTREREREGKLESNYSNSPKSQYDLVLDNEINIICDEKCKMTHGINFITRKISIQNLKKLQYWFFLGK